MEPGTGVFLTVDSCQGSTFDPQSLHKYLYANASPVNFRDPTGYDSLTEMVVALKAEGILLGMEISFS
jgi:hypothetical protein